MFETVLGNGIAEFFEEKVFGVSVFVDGGEGAAHGVDDAFLGEFFHELGSEEVLIVYADDFLANVHLLYLFFWLFSSSFFCSFKRVLLLWAFRMRGHSE